MTVTYIKFFLYFIYIRYKNILNMIFITSQHIKSYEMYIFNNQFSFTYDFLPVFLSKAEVSH